MVKIKEPHTIRNLEANTSKVGIKTKPQMAMKKVALAIQKMRMDSSTYSIKMLLHYFYLNPRPNV